MDEGPLEKSTHRKQRRAEKTTLEKQTRPENERPAQRAATARNPQETEVMRKTSAETIAETSAVDTNAETVAETVSETSDDDVTLSPSRSVCITYLLISCFE